MSVSFDVQVKEILNDYGDEAADIVAECVEKSAEDTVKRLRNAGEPHWKKFRKAWTKTITKKRLQTEATVHLKRPYSRIGHLLEFDHSSRSGGRKVSGYHFIEPEAQETEKKFVEMLEEKL